MLTPKRHQLIVELIKQKETVTIQELIKITKASISTIRRDLSELERSNLIKRIHRGARLLIGVKNKKHLFQKSHPSM